MNFDVFPISNEMAFTQIYGKIHDKCAGKIVETDNMDFNQTNSKELTEDVEIK